MDNSKKSEKQYPDGRGKRTTDPNEPARWVVEQSTKSAEKRLNDSAEADSCGQ